MERRCLPMLSCLPDTMVQDTVQFPTFMDQSSVTASRAGFMAVRYTCATFNSGIEFTHVVVYILSVVVSDRDGWS